MVKTSTLRRGREMFRSILSVSLTLLVLLLLLGRAVAQGGDEDLSRFADEDERTVIFHSKFASFAHSQQARHL